MNDWICDECGKHFDWEYRFKDCDECHGDLVEADRCPFCGEWKPADVTFCETCYDLVASPEGALLVAEGSKHRETVRVNGFVFDALGEEGINEILEEYVKHYGRLRRDEDGSLKREVELYIGSGDPEWVAESIDKAHGGWGRKFLPKRAG